MIAFDDLLREVSRNGRVCPQPKHWHRLYELLPDRRRRGAGWEPPLPLILDGWHCSSDAEKRERFHLHLRRANEHGAIQAVADLLLGLKPCDWLVET